jgi:hypothetical protein
VLHGDGTGQGHGQGAREFELIVGHHVGAAEGTYRFTMDLAYIALQFATRCRYLTYPRQAEADQ